MTSKTTENSELCQACGGEVIAFVQKPHMYRFILREDNDTKFLPFINDVVCVNCMTDLIKFKAEVLAHRWDAAKESVDKK
jgi:hypothetical protein